jgi:hypothetical protein
MMTNNEPNPPVWPSSVKLFRDTDDVEWMQNELHATQDPYSRNSFTCDHHFSRKRTALLFAPGTYKDAQVEIGYYVELAGLGVNADDVKFVGHGPYLPALNKHLHKRAVTNENGESVQVPVGTCLDSFWRSAENFALHDANLMWAVSQAAPLRRVHVVAGAGTTSTTTGSGSNCHVYLHDGAAYASGGHMANCKLDDGVALYAGGQQQYLFRNVHFGHGASGGAWSMVYVGCSGQVPEQSTGATTVAGEATVTVVEEPRVRIEKPYIALKSGQATEFELRVPKAAWKGETTYTVEPLLDGKDDDGVRDFSKVRVVREDEPACRIQEALDEGKDVVLAPGIFALEKTIELRQKGQVLLGLGFATLEAPTDGTPCICVAPGVPGVRIAGIMLEATEKSSSARDNGIKSTLLEWGEEGRKDPGCKVDPGALFDVFVRVGGATAGNRANLAVDAMMRIHSGHVIGDNIWLWRADHALLRPNEESNYPHISPIFWQSEQHEYRVETGIVVTGDDVTMYGLAVEHANGHQTVWSGERGAVHFYQCEFPYGVTRDFAENEFRGYLVKDNVHEHEVYAPGIYSNFRNDAVFVSTAIEHPEKPGVQVINPFAVKLDNQGGILSIANGKGSATDRQGTPVRMNSTD